MWKRKWRLQLHLLVHMPRLLSRKQPVMVWSWSWSWSLVFCLLSFVFVLVFDFVFVLLSLFFCHCSFVIVLLSLFFCRLVFVFCLCICLCLLHYPLIAVSTSTRSIFTMEGNLDRKESGASLSCSLLHRCTLYSTWLWHGYRCAQVGRKVAFPIWFVSLPIRTQRFFKSKNDESLLFSIRD